MAMKKKALAGMIAASIIAAGGIVTLQQVKADAATTSTPAAAGAQTSNTAQHNGWNHGRGHRGGFRFGGGNLVKETASILNMDASTITDELKQGKTFVQIAQEKANMSETDYLKKLVTAETQAVQSEVSSGKLTQTQADKITSDLSDRLKQQIEHSFKGQDPAHRFPGRGGGPGFMGGTQSMAQYLGITTDELKKDLQAGLSLKDIAQAKGISEDQLINKIKDGMTGKIKQFVEHKGGFGPQQKQSAPASSGNASATTS